MQAGADVVRRALTHLQAEFVTMPVTEFSFSPNWTSGAVLAAYVSPTFVGASVFQLINAIPGCAIEGACCTAQLSRSA